MYNKILVPLDGSNLSECVLPHVESMSKSCGIKEVVFIRIVEPRSMPYTSDEYRLMNLEFEQMETAEKIAAQNYLEKLIEKMKVQNVRFSCKVKIGEKIADIIADYAFKNAADLIIIATHGRSGVSRWALGSIADRVLRSSCVPVLMIRAPGCMSGI